MSKQTQYVTEHTWYMTENTWGVAKQTWYVTKQTWYMSQLTWYVIEHAWYMTQHVWSLWSRDRTRNKYVSQKWHYRQNSQKVENQMKPLKYEIAQILGLIHFYAQIKTFFFKWSHSKMMKPSRHATVFKTPKQQMWMTGKRRNYRPLTARRRYIHFLVFREKDEWSFWST